MFFIEHYNSREQKYGRFQEGGCVTETEIFDRFANKALVDQSEQIVGAVKVTNKPQNVKNHDLSELL